MSLRATRPAPPPRPVATGSSTDSDAASATPAVHGPAAPAAPALPPLGDFTVLATRLAAMPLACVLLPAADGVQALACVGLAPADLLPATAQRLLQLAGNTPLQADDITLDPRLRGLPLHADGTPLRALVAMPLGRTGGAQAGCLLVADTLPRHLDTSALDSLVRLAGQLSAVLAQHAASEQRLHEERRLLEREAELDRLALVAERTTHAVVITDADNRIRWCNPAFTTFSGAPAAECLGRRPGAVLPFLRGDAQAREPLRQALAARAPARIRTHIAGQRKAWQWVDIDLQPLHGSDGAFQGCIAVVSDVSELVAQTRHAQAILQSLPNGVVVYDQQLRVAQANASAERIFGVPPGGLQGSNTVAEFTDAVDDTGLPLPPQRRPSLLTLIDGQPRYDVVYGLRMRDGRRRWLRVSTAVMRDAAGVITGVISSFLDHTEERKQHALLQLAIDAARITPWHWNLVEDAVQFDAGAANAAGLQFAGAPDAMNEVPLWPAVHRDDVGRLRDQVRLLDAEPTQALRVEFRLPAQGGGWRWVLAAGAAAERDAQGHVTRMSGVVLDISDRKANEAALQRAATTDALTGLPNRTVLGDRLEQALRSARRHGRHGALLFIDLDHFKRINDVYGHVVGDRVLQATGQRLLGELRSEDTLSRMGGDELMVLLPDLGADAELAARHAERVGTKLLSVLSQPLRVDGLEYTLGASMGSTVFPKSPRETAEDLVREADTAMYAAKSAGRGTLRRYEHSMQHHLAERLALERDLRHAVEQRAFSYQLQGQWEAGGALAGAELLLRWKHPERGPVSPAQFIPVAEEGLLILSIGRWVIEQACMLLARWIAEGRALPLAINVSPRQFREPAFADDLVALTRASGVPPSLLTLEITEGVLLDEGAAQRLAQLAGLGFRFSIDDFGTGYSSLMYLKKLPVHELKIDRAFVRDLTTDPEDAAIVQAMLAIARKFKLQVVAEGVETEEQAAFLRANDCHLLQGYLLGRPQNVERFEADCMPPAR
jgi:diguanylate cyclase (GGDEF)-like protein/PAS domain S-box-containing protein